MDDLMTPIQKVAIETIIAVFQKPLEFFVVQLLNKDKPFPLPSRDNWDYENKIAYHWNTLTYQEAVKIIQWANENKRR